MELLILAAGMGSRFGGLKQIEPIDEYGNFILDYSIYDAIEAGFDKVTFVIKEEMYEDFRNTVGKRIENKIKTKYSFQKLSDLPQGYSLPKNRVKPWGTAHAVISAKDVVEDNFVIINADDYYGKEAFKIAATYLKELDSNTKGIYANIVYKISNTITENGSVKRGVCIGNKNNICTEMIESVIEKDDMGNIVAREIEYPNRKFVLDKDQLVSMNMFAFSVDIFDYLTELFPSFLDENKENLLVCEYLIPCVLTKLIKDNKVVLNLISTESVWYGVTYREDKDYVVKSLKYLVDNGEYKKGLWD